MRKSRQRREIWTYVGLLGRAAMSGLGLTLLALTTGCTASPPASTPTPIVIVVTATPAPAKPVPPTAAKPAAVEPKPTVAPAAAATAAPKPAAKVAASPTPGVAEQRLAVGRTNSYRGLEFTVEEARSGERIERQQAPRGKMLVGMRMRVHNPSGQFVHFGSGPLNELMRLQLPDASAVKAESVDPFVRPPVEPQETIAGWAYWEVDRSVPLEPLKLVLGGGNETQAVITLTGPEQAVSPRSFEFLRSTDEVRGLLWSVSGGEIRLDIPGQQANPGQEFIVVRVRATNPSPAEVTLRGRGSVPQEGTEYLRVEADNGVLLQPSAELNALPTDFPPKAEQDALYAWQLPRASKNPKLVILSPDGSQHKLDLGPLPPP